MFPCIGARSCIDTIQLHSSSLLGAQQMAYLVDCIAAMCDFFEKHSALLEPLSAFPPPKFILEYDRKCPNFFKEDEVDTAGDPAEEISPPSFYELQAMASRHMLSIASSLLMRCTLFAKYHWNLLCQNKLLWALKTFPLHMQILCALHEG